MKNITTKILGLLILNFSFLNFNCEGQNFSSSSMTFSVQSGITLEDMIGADVALGINQNGAPSALIPFPSGFSFIYCGKKYYDFSVTPDGWVRLGQTGILESTNNLSSVTNYPIIAPYWSDMYTPSTGGILYKLIGQPPNRKLLIQWNVIVSSTNVKFQTWLGETTGVIEFVYGGIPSNSSTYSIGIGNSKLNGQTYASISCKSPVLTSSINYNTSISSSSSIPNSTCFRLTPDTIIPLIPNNFNFITQARCVQYNWTDNSNSENFFEIFRSIDNITFSKLKEISSVSKLTTGTIYSSEDSLLTPLTQYFYKIIAKNYGTIPDTFNVSLFTSPPLLSGIKTIPGDYASIKDALNAISCYQLNSNLILELQPNYNGSVETYPITFVNDSFTGANKTITIRPSINSPLINFNSSGSSTFDFNSNKFIIIDGRPGGQGSTKGININNTSTTGCAIRFINEACYNSIKYCNIIGVSTSSSLGVVTFSTSSKTLGNNNNLIEYCDIYAGTTLPRCLIFSKGTVLKPNIDNTIRENYLHNFYHYSGSYGCFLEVGNSKWTFEKNSFYEDLPTIGTGNWSAITINDSIGGGFNIIENNFGGNQPMCGGSPLIVDNNGKSIQVVCVNSLSPISSEIQGNIFTNISFNYKYSSTVYDNAFIFAFHGISNIGTSIPNIIGSVGGQTSISLTSSNAIFYGIFTRGSIFSNIQNNKISNIDFSYFFNPIGLTSVDSCRIEKNTIGSNSLPVTLKSSSITGSSSLTGIDIRVLKKGPCIIKNNSIANISSSSPIGTTTGILFNNSYSIPLPAVLVEITDNKIFNLTNLNSIVTLNSSAGITGIEARDYNGSTITISNNEIYSLKNLSTVNKVGIYGVSVLMNDSGFANIYNNNLHSMSLLSDNVNSSVTGIKSNINLNTIGKVNLVNNIIRLGISSEGFNDTLSYEIIGMDLTGSTNAFFNTVFIGGIGVDSHAKSECFKLADFTKDSLFNNIINNVRSLDNVAINVGNLCYYAQSTGPFKCNHNAILSSGTGNSIGILGSNIYTSFNNWQGAGYDVNGVKSNPLFVNPLGDATTIDMHVLNTSPVENEGIQIPYIITDYEGKIRADYTPDDIGAYCINNNLTCNDTIQLSTNLTSNNMLICKNGSFPLSATSNIAAQPVNYQWYKNNIPVSTDSNYTLTTEGDYYVSANNTCGTVNSQTTNFVTTPANATLTTNGTFICKDIPVAQRTPVKMQDANYSKYGQGELYRWYKKNSSGTYDLIVQGKDKHIYKSKYSGRFFFRVFNNDCKNSIASNSFFIHADSCLTPKIGNFPEENYNEAQDLAAIEASENIETLTNLDELEDESFSSLSIYPNPFSESFSISYKNYNNSTLIIIDVLGKEVKREKMTGEFTNVSLEKNVKGIYNVRIVDFSGNVMSSGRVVKE